MSASQSGVFSLQEFTDLGAPLVAGRLYTYTQGTTTHKTAYTDKDGSIAHTYTSDGVGGQYIGLNARGELPASLYLAAGSYDITLKDSTGATIWTRRADPVDDSAAALDSAIRADLASTSDVGKGGALVGYRKNYASAVAQLVSTPLDCIVSVSDFMTPTQVTQMMSGVVKPDITTAFQNAINALPRQGSPNWQQWKLLMPIGVATLSAKVSILNQQGGELHMGGTTLNGNFADVMLEIGDSSGSNDVLWFHIFGGQIIQNSTAANSGAVKAVHNYSCSYNNMFIYGGRIAFSLDGNANTINTCTFRGAKDSNVKTGGIGGNCESNKFIGCSNELSDGYGYDLSVSSGIGGFTVIDGGYCERNALGNIYITNTQKTTIRDVYFNLQNNASGVILGGTVGYIYPSPWVKVSDCRVQGGASAKFIEELSATSINCAYEDNTLESGVCDMYGSAQKSVNLRRARKMIQVTNGTSIINTDSTGPSDGWTLSGGGAGNVAAVASVSPYVNGSACSISFANSYQYQQINCPASSLIRVSVWAKCSGALANADVQLWSLGLGGQYAAINTTSTTASRLDIYLTPAMRSSATSFLLLLRNTGTGDNAQFCDIDIEDMTV